MSWTTGIRLPEGDDGIFSPPRPERLWVPTRLLSNEYQGLLPRNKSGRGVKLTTLSSSEVKNPWIYTSTPPIRLHNVVLS